MKIIKTGFKIYTLYSIAGRVTPCDKAVIEFARIEKTNCFNTNKETSTIPIIVKTRTTIYNRFFVNDTNNIQHAVQLNNFDIICCEGDKIIAIWAIAKGESRGPYIAFINQTTQQTFFNVAELQRMFQVHWFYYLSLPALLSVAVFLTGCWIISVVCFFISLFVTWWLSFRITATNVSRFMRCFEFHL